MADHGRKSPTKITLYSSTGSKITICRPQSEMLKILPPSPEEEIFSEESIASSDEEDLKSMSDELRLEETENPEHDADVLASSDEVDLNCMTDKFRLKETEITEHDSDVVSFHKMCDKPEINVEVPPRFICTLKAMPVSNEAKNKELSNMPENIKKKCEGLGTRDRSEMFKIEGNFNIDKEFKVMVKFDGDESNQYLDFFAVVKYDKTWFEIPAEEKDDQVVFRTKKMEYFFILCSPKTTTMKLSSESDTIYQHESDPKIMVEFQKGSVEKTTPISITVLPVIQKQLAKLTNDFEKRIIKDMSPILIVSQPGKPDFNKPVRCTLPCKPSENRKTLMVRLDHDDQVVVSELEIKDNDNGTHSYEIKSNNICSIVQTAQQISDDRSTMNQLRDEVLYVVGEAKRCILQTSLNKTKRLIRTEIIEITNKDNVKMLEQGFRRVGEISKVITLRKGQRIRADLTGRIRQLQRRRHFGLFVIFQPYLHNTYMEFGFEIKKDMGTYQHGEIMYSSDNYDKKLLDTLHFDPLRPFSSHQRSTLQRRQFLQKDQPHHIRDVREQMTGKGHGKPSLIRHQSDLTSYGNRLNNNIGVHSNMLKAGPKAGVVSRPNYVTCCTNPEIQRSKTDVCVRTNVCQNIEMNIASRPQTEDAVIRENTCIS